MKYTAAAIMAAFFLSGCGADSEDSDVSTLAVFDSSRCGTGLEVDASGDYLITDTGEELKIKTSGAGVSVEIVGTGHKVCVDGNLTALTLTDGSGSDVWVSGSVSGVNVSGSGHDVYVFGDAGTVVVSGSGNDVYAGSVQSVDVDGAGNDVEDIENYQD
jgi:hypothetical protein